MNYYNEFDPDAAAWIRELISGGLIPPGHVDERSIKDVGADDLRGFTQCHFFAGVGGWSLALRLAGWPENKPVWTGSCPCQPYSTAGKQQAMSDDRDLWPVFGRLIAECRPEYVFGEQVENAIQHGWLDRVYTDLESQGYTVGATVLGAHSVGAPHRRQRLYWGACRVADRHEELRERIGDGRQGGRFELADRCGTGRLAENSDSRGCGGWCDGDYSGDDGKIQAPGLRDDSRVSDSELVECERDMRGGRIVGQQAEKRTSAEFTGYRNHNGMDVSESIGRNIFISENIGETTGKFYASSNASGVCRRLPDSEGERCGEARESVSGYPERTSGRGDRFCVADFASEGLERRSGKQHAGERIFVPDGLESFSPWFDFRLIYCRDEKVRRVPAESLLFGMADGLSESMDGGGFVGISEDGGFPLTTQKEGRAMLLKGYGNAIVPQVAAEFIMAFMEV